MLALLNIFGHWEPVCSRGTAISCNGELVPATAVLERDSYTGVRRVKVVPFSGKGQVLPVQSCNLFDNT